MGRESDREGTYSWEDSNSLATWKEEFKIKYVERELEIWKLEKGKTEEDLKWETWTGEESGHEPRPIPRRLEVDDK